MPRAQIVLVLVVVLVLEGSRYVGATSLNCQTQSSRALVETPRPTCQGCSNANIEDDDEAEDDLRPAARRRGFSLLTQRLARGSEEQIHRGRTWVLMADAAFAEVAGAAFLGE